MGGSDGLWLGKEGRMEKWGCKGECQLRERCKW